ncbi:hypothetical protein [Szabonella alba]|uniref:Methyltransferase domain-containing protein n=1 Tax=Szabonella alba TaxID=2804194 RepID=A0A8K0VBS5_9RHOB|nr:hypothetical protein [Szabonella alba]MBL4916347.1 hypothetical protein [Szabonella alba]
MNDTTLSAPELTMPPEAADLLRETYAGAGVILEYGSGGSTVLAGSMPGKRVFAVESDTGWITRMKDWFAGNPPASKVVLHHGDIGPTGKWGHPVDESHWRRFLNYPLTVWDRPDFAHPDVVLVDGRFRIGCFLAVLMRITRPVTLLFDDYTGRASYRAVEDFARPAGFAGRMARFEITPRPPRPEEFGRWVKLMQRPL